MPPSLRKIGHRIAKAPKIGSRVAQRSLKIGKRVAGEGAAAATLAGRPALAIGLAAASDGMGTASHIIGRTHKQIKSDLEKPANKKASTVGEG